MLFAEVNITNSCHLWSR